MKIPKYIDNLLKRRTKLAEQLSFVCGTVDNWLRTNGVEPDEACWLSGCEIYVNPVVAEDEVRRSIEEKSK